jgi:type II secretory pathway pseudopilin PulG
LRRVTIAALLLVALGAGCGGGSNDAKDRAAARQAAAQRAHARAAKQQARRERARARRRRAKRRKANQEAGGTPAPTSQPTTTCPQGQLPNGPNGSCQSTGGAPSVDSPQGKQELKQSPDCQGEPPPPPGYHGPVQC